MSADAQGLCPVCDNAVEYERWGEDVTCGHCGTLLRHHHECGTGDEGDEDCYDWLEAV